MTIKQHISDDKKEISIAIEERFDFSLHQKFKEAYIQCNEENSIFTIDLTHTTYMDSSALGMILLLKDHADKSKSKVEINNPNQSVNKILEIAQFHRLLTINV